MDNRVFDAVLSAFGAGTSIENGLERDTPFGTVQAVQEGNTLTVRHSSFSHDSILFDPILTITNVNDLNSYVISATIQLIFHT